MKKIAFLLTIAVAVSCGISLTASAGTPGPVTLENVTVTDANNTSSKPKISAESKLPTAKLKVKDVVVGTGAAATPSSSVKVQYVGVRYADGKQFDSSWEKGGPISFRLNKVVRGFTEGIGGNDTFPPMKVGGRRIMIVPSEMGYGANGTPDGRIPPDATIVFVVDLIAVK